MFLLSQWNSQYKSILVNYYFDFKNGFGSGRVMSLYLDIDGEAGEVGPALVEAGGDGEAVWDGAGLLVLHWVSATPVQAVAGHSALVTAVTVVATVTGALHHRVELGQTFCNFILNNAIVNLLQSKYWLWMLNLESDKQWQAQDTATINCIILIVWMEIMTQFQSINNKHTWSGHHQVVVQGEAAYVDTPGRHVVVPAALRHVDHGGGRGGHLEVHGDHGVSEAVVGVAVVRPRVIHVYLHDLHVEEEDGGVLLVWPGGDINLVGNIGHGVLQLLVCEYGQVRRRPGIHLTRDHGGVSDKSRSWPGLDGGDDGWSTCYRYLPAGDHWSSVSVICVAGHVLHVTCHVVNVGDHVTCHLGPQRMTIEIEGHMRRWSPHGDTQHLHAAALQHLVDGVDGWGLK